MFKTTKTQFAIRKLKKGAVAVLLSFGILANTTMPLVSAAITEDDNQTETISENNESAVENGGGNSLR